MAYWDKGLLQVSENNRYLQNGTTPFFWLGDTAWLLFQQCSKEEAYIYLKNRKEKGYNVIQATLIHSMPGEYHSSLARVQRDVTSKEYWDHCVEIVKIAEELGLYMALLPTWGSIVKQGILTMDNVDRYADYLASRFKDSPNVLWLLGGDIKGQDYIELYRHFGLKMKAFMPDKLVGFHPFGRTSSSLWFHNEEWLDFNMYQSGHRRYDQGLLNQWDDVEEEFYGEDNWKYVDRDLSYTTIKPTLDGEPSYEWIPQGLHDPKEPYWQAWHVRRYAYWSVFQGAMGHTYGDNAIMQFYNNLEEKGNYGVIETWQDSMHHEGGSHMKHLVDLMTSVDFMSGRPAEELLLSGQKEKHDRVSVFAGSNYIFCYTYSGNEFTLDLSKYIDADKTMHAYWFDPTSGVYSYYKPIIGTTSFEAKPVKRFAGHNDWVLVIKED